MIGLQEHQLFDITQKIRKERWVFTKRELSIRNCIEMSKVVVSQKFAAFPTYQKFPIFHFKT